MLPFVTDAPPTLEESLAGNLDVIRGVLSRVRQAALHVVIGADLRNVCLDNETSWTEMLRIGLHVLKLRPGMAVREVRKSQGNQRSLLHVVRRVQD